MALKLLKIGSFATLLLFTMVVGNNYATAVGTVKKSASSPSSLLANLKVSSETAGSSYSRSAFKHWTDADQDGCDTRDEVLGQESKTKISCNLQGGSWVSAYDGVKTKNPSTFDIDHFVPLKEAWESGAHSWNSDTRMRFANDLDYSLSLIAVSASSNRSKSDRDPTSWLPRATGYKCLYVGTWVAVKYRWSLTVDNAEMKILKDTLNVCGTKAQVPPPSKAKIGMGSSSVAPSNQPTATPPGGIDPQFSSCAEAKRNGFTGPYTKGKDPEYFWYQDRDGDGVVCE